jgi:hypothetical protein
VSLRLCSELEVRRNDGPGVDKPKGGGVLLGPTGMAALGQEPREEESNSESDKE